MKKLHSGVLLKILILMVVFFTYGCSSNKNNPVETQKNNLNLKDSLKNFTFTDLSSKWSIFPESKKSYFRMDPVLTVTDDFNDNIYDLNWCTVIDKDGIDTVENNGNFIFQGTPATRTIPLETVVWSMPIFIENGFTLQNMVSATTPVQGATLQGLVVVASPFTSEFLGIKSNANGTYDLLYKREAQPDITI